MNIVKEKVISHSWQTNLLAWLTLLKLIKKDFLQPTVPIKGVSTYLTIFQEQRLKSKEDEVNILINYEKVLVLQLQGQDEVIVTVWDSYLI